MIRLRFVTTGDLVSAGIRLAEDFPYSHVEAVMPDGSYLGAHADGGVKARQADYDAGKFTAEKFVNLNDCSATEETVFNSYLQGKIGTPYDYEAILGFVARLDLHTAGAVICSALQTLALRRCGYFPFPLAVRAHETSPRDLGMMLSVRVRF